MRDDDLPAPARAAVAAYRKHFADGDESGHVVVAWAPGRINLIGEHTDYSGGYVLPVAIDRVVALAGRRHAEENIAVYSTHHGEFARFAADPEMLAADASDDLPTWARYVRAVAAESSAVPRKDADASMPPTAVPGFSAAIAGDVPLGGGLSSSAALEVATATFEAALGGAALPPMETALLCQRAEHRGVGVLCGILDQAASCLAQPDAALLLDCRSYAFSYVPLHLPDLALAVFDTGVPHTLAASVSGDDDGDYNERRRECGEAAAALAAAIAKVQPERIIHSLRDVAPADLAAFGSALAEPLLRRARHVVTENERVFRAVDALRAGDAVALGSLISAAHASLRDDYAVSCAELDTVVEIAEGVAGVFGARMMGAGFGGSALILARRDAFPALEDALAQEYPARSGRIGSLHVCRVSGGPASALVP